MAFMTWQTPFSKGHIFFARYPPPPSLHSHRILSRYRYPPPPLQGRRILFRDRPALQYDVLSVNVGITPAASRIPGAEQYTTSVKPIDRSVPACMRGGTMHEGLYNA